MSDDTKCPACEVMRQEIDYLRKMLAEMMRARFSCEWVDALDVGRKAYAPPSASVYRGEERRKRPR